MFLKEIRNTFCNLGTNFVSATKCAVPENIHTLPMEGQREFQGGTGSHKVEFLKEGMGLNCNFQMGGGMQTKKPSVGGVWIYFLEQHNVA